MVCAKTPPPPPKESERFFRFTQAQIDETLRGPRHQRARLPPRPRHGEATTLSHRVPASDGRRVLVLEHVTPAARPPSRSSPFTHPPQPPIKQAAKPSSNYAMTTPCAAAWPAWTTTAAWRWRGWCGRRGPRRAAARPRASPLPHPNPRPLWNPSTYAAPASGSSTCRPAWTRRPWWRRGAQRRPLRARGARRAALTAAHAAGRLAKGDGGGGSGDGEGESEPD